MDPKLDCAPFGYARTKESGQSVPTQIDCESSQC